MTDLHYTSENLIDHQKYVVTKEIGMAQVLGKTRVVVQRLYQCLSDGLGKHRGRVSKI